MATKYVWECETCGREFNTREACEAHEEHCKNKRSLGIWEILGIIALIVIALWFIGTQTASDYQTTQTEQNTEYEKASKEWLQYKNVLNNDTEKIKSIGENECKNPQTHSEFSNCVGALSPRLELYKTHLLEARSFLQTEGYLFSNRLELQQNLDDQIAWVSEGQTKLTSAVNEYNANVQAQQNQQQAVLDLLKILAGVV
ncbi:MAG: hypothetical protein KKE05_01200 [Nanoarchaeota archaeon]|nr:hypothetical protein [Nanoarchaeota archaeon]